MILKIQDLQTLKTDDIIWTFFDKIENVKYCNLNYEPETHDGFDYNLVTQETKDELLRPSNDDIPEPKIVAIYCSGSSGNQNFSLVTEKMVYLLNDEGKTIERIN